MEIWSCTCCKSVLTTIKISQTCWRISYIIWGNERSWVSFFFAVLSDMGCLITYSLYYDPPSGKHWLCTLKYEYEYFPKCRPRWHWTEYGHPKISPRAMHWDGTNATLALFASAIFSALDFLPRKHNEINKISIHSMTIWRNFTASNPEWFAVIYLTV